MAEFGNKDRSDGAKHLEPDWTYNIGEAVIDIDAVTLSSFEVGILVLGEKSLHCLKDNCVSLKYAKRLEYKALCFRAYMIGTHSRDGLKVDSGKLEERIIETVVCKIREKGERKRKGNGAS